jgi:hypothetical protein
VSIISNNIASNFRIIIEKRIRNIWKGAIMDKFGVKFGPRLCYTARKARKDYPPVYGHRSCGYKNEFWTVLWPHLSLIMRKATRILSG